MDALFHTFVPLSSFTSSDTASRQSYPILLRKSFVSRLSFCPRSSPLRLRCSLRSSNGGGDSSRSDKDDANFLEAQVVEAVGLLPSKGHLYMTLANGAEVEVDHLNPPKGRLLYRSSNPTIFLRILADTELFLPIIVGDAAINMLMKAMRGEETMMRPNQYNLMKDLVAALNFEVRMVRVTERIADTYYARIFIGKMGQDEMQSVDARPSDAINLAVRCKVPIYVNKDLVYADAVKPVYATTRVQSNKSALDCPEKGHDILAEEMLLVKNMLVAVAEERYNDAAHWRDELNGLRKKGKHIPQV